MTGTLYRLTEFFARDRRTEPRYSLLLTGKAITTSGSFDIVIRDLSLSGAQIQGRVLPAIGKLAILRKGDLEVSGRIAWRDGDRAGLAFEQPLAPERLFALVHKRSGTPDVVPAKATAAIAA